MKTTIKKFTVDYVIPAILVFVICLAGVMLFFDAILARMAGYF